MADSNHKAGSPLPPTKKHRRLKVREAYHSYQLSQCPPERTAIGQIDLKGHWLIEAGFAIDAPVTIRVMDGCLVLTTEHSG